MIKGMMTAALGLAALLTASPSQAEYLIYTNRTTFEAALTTETTETFNELGPTVQNFGTTGLSQAQGLIQPIVVTGSNSYLYSASASVFAGFYPSNATYLIGPNSSNATDGISVVLPSNAANAAGADLVNFGGAGLVSFFGTTSFGEQFSGSVAVDGISGNSPLGFLGVITNSTADKVISLTFSSPIGSFQNIVVDNVSFGTSTPSVPEPSAFVLLAMGTLVVGLGLSRRRLAKVGF